MGLFKPATNTQCYLKAGILGFAGSGKTRTASNLSIGLYNILKERDLKPNPVFFLDTETGSDWMIPRFNEAGIPLETAKTRAFVDLMTAVKEAQKEASILIIDSVSHFWKEIMDTYLRKKSERMGKKIHRMEFPDWAVIKSEWAAFTDAYVNSQLHIVMCGRAGYEYDYFENDDGKKELEKTGIKMKAETELGFEPSLLILMEREMDMDTKTVYRTAKILKDRSDTIDGKEFKNPTFQSFLPHVNWLNLGGVHVGVDTSRTSDGLIGSDGKTDYEREMKEKDITLDEIQSALVNAYPGTGKEEKKAKTDLLQKHFGSMSWERIKTMKLGALKEGYQNLIRDLFTQEEKPLPESDPTSVILPSEYDDLFHLMQKADEKDRGAVMQSFLKEFGVSSLNDLPSGRFEEAKKWIEQGVGK